MNSYELIKKLYKNNKGEPFEASPSQIEIFECITKRQAPDGKRNVHCITHTRFGKSDTVAMGLLTRISTYAEKWALIAPSNEQAKIILSYIIGHIFDNEYTKEKFRVQPDENLERIRRERSKRKITFKIGNGGIGELLVLSAQESRSQNPMDALMGFGAPNICIDESAIIDDIKHTGVLRMLGDVKDPFLFEIGNPFRRNHFYKASNIPDNKNVEKNNYYHIFVDYIKGLEEGRITQEQVERMRNKPFFDVLYECKFPPADAIDADGWRPLVIEEVLDAAKRKITSIGHKRMGCDIGIGGDATVFTIRTKNYAFVRDSNHVTDTMEQAKRLIDIMKDEDIDAQDVFIDIVGPGLAVYSRCAEYGYNLQGVVGGTIADTPATYCNIKAENFWNYKTWLEQGGCIANDPRFDDILVVKYKEESDKRIRIIPKKELARHGIASPNVADAMALTFTHMDLMSMDINYESFQPKYAHGTY